MKPTVSPLKTLQRVSILTTSILLLGVSPAQALTFNFLRNSNTTESDYNLALPAFTAAGQRWAENFSDDVTINLQVGYAALGSGILGSTSTSSGTASYSVFRAALSTDAGSSDDHSMVSHLPGQSVAMLINRTSNNPNGAGSATPYLDNNASANNSTIRLTSANAKALGLLAANHAGLDGSITFSNDFLFDFSPEDGIDPGNFDFVGVATHEIGHALGFMSGVDVLDLFSPPASGPFPTDSFTYVSPLDLVRFSTRSVALGNGVIDWTADAFEKYFSVDGGATPLAGFSTGSNFGDGNQASHWKDHLGLGLLDPTVAPGENLTISDFDRQLFDVIGWDRATLNVPESATTTFALLLFGAASTLLTRKVSALTTKS